MKDTPWKIKQIELFLYIKKHNWTKTNFTQLVAQIFETSSTTVYKKMRGESALSLAELIKLKEHFNILLDPFFVAKNAPTSFQFDALRSAPKTPLDFLKNVTNHLTTLTNARSVNYLYLCNEVPLYHILQFPLLARFKMYVWNALSWRIIGTADQEFTKELYEDLKGWDEEVDKMLKIYFDYSGKEIWNTLFFDATIEQIKYKYMCGHIGSLELCLELLDELDNLKNLLLDFTKKGVKYIKRDPNISSANGKFYYTSLYSGSELIYVESDKRRTVITGFDTPNLMRSVDPRMTTYSKDHIDKILRYSMNITESNQIQRKLFFAGLTKKIEFARQDVNHFSHLRG